MYSKIANPVPVPTVGQIHVALKNGYVTWCLKGKWDKEKKYTVDNRISIGKLVSSYKDLMYLNKNYFMKVMKLLVI